MIVSPPRFKPFIYLSRIDNYDVPPAAALLLLLLLADGEEEPPCCCWGSPRSSAVFSSQYSRNGSLKMYCPVDVIIMDYGLWIKCSAKWKTSLLVCVRLSYIIVVHKKCFILTRTTHLTQRPHPPRQTSWSTSMDRFGGNLVSNQWPAEKRKISSQERIVAVVVVVATTTWWMIY